MENFSLPGDTGKEKPSAPPGGWLVHTYDTTPTIYWFISRVSETRRILNSPGYSDRNHPEGIGSFARSLSPDRAKR